MRSSSHSGILQGNPDRSETKKPERNLGHCPPGLYIVGIGPGSVDHLSLRAKQVIQAAECIVGYTTYVELIKPLIEDKDIVATRMKKEVQRVQTAIESALEGKVCALISSGDPGIYAMAGLALELCQSQSISIAPMIAFPEITENQKTLLIEIVPGIPALAAGASLLGAPLTHDFAAISLSDLLTPWKAIEKRLNAAAMADFVIVLYNPKSKRRIEHLTKAQEIILQHRSPETPVGIVTSAMRSKQDVSIICLKDLHKAEVNMQTTVFVGNSVSVTYGCFMFTPRGYAGKYDLKK
jgi:precorrin-3B C17-methyltransferase